MVNKCCVCKIKEIKGRNGPFHRIPKDPVLRDSWLKALNRTEAKEWDRVCRLHFHSSDYWPYREKVQPLLKPKAVPFLNLYAGERDQDNNTSLQAVEPSALECGPDRQCYMHQTSSTTMHIDSQEPDHHVTAGTSNTNVLSSDDEMHDETTCEEQLFKFSPRKAREKMLCEKQNHQAKKIKSLEDSLRHLRIKMRKQEDRMKEMERRLDETEYLRDLLKLVASLPVLQQILNKLKNANTPYSDELKKFAITVHFYSGRAYEYLRSSFQNVLPHPRSIRRWYEVVNGNPGFTDEAFRAIANKAEKEKVLCNIVIDEISIRSLTEWNRHKFLGLVDLGTEFDQTKIGSAGTLNNGTDLNSEKLIAKHALVFMAVSVISRWKVPIGYFFIQGLSGTDRAALLKMCLQKLHETGASTYSITFDGTSVNLKMAVMMGANFDTDNPKPYFDHPVTNEKVYVFIDPSHDIKLVRNVTKDKGPILTEDNRPIEWQYIVSLFNKEQEQGLRTGTKLTKRHINCDTEKMNVRLAVQTLSASVAAALLYYEQIGDDMFIGASSTAEYCDYFDTAFDILNSRSKYSKKPYNFPLSQNTIEGYINFEKKFTAYVFALKFSNGKKVVDSRARTGFIGLVICLKNAIELYNFLCEKGFLEYLLMFKISQDHLETFFSSIRSCGGFNNNPSCVQFQSAYKKLLVRHEIAASKYGNCSILEVANILPVQAKVNDIIDSTETLPNALQIDHDYLNSVVSLSRSQEDISDYIGGFIVRKIKTKLTCKECLLCLQKETTSNLLIAIKSRGRLINPSNDVTYICQWVERVVRQYTANIFHSNIKQVIHNKVKQIVYNRVFLNLQEHGNDFTLQKNHRNQMINFIIDYYIDIRFFHIGRTAFIPEKKIRQRYNKLVLFANQ